MKLVIDIDEDQYKTIVNKIKAIRTEISKKGYANNDVVPIGWVSIAEGTPLIEWLEEMAEKFKRERSETF